MKIKQYIGCALYVIAKHLLFLTVDSAVFGGAVEGGQRG